MADCRVFQFGLVLLIMAAMSGLLGFVIIYHYASFERPMQHFAIVIDAGSTQTRSSLFTVSLDVPNLVRWTNEINEHDKVKQEYQHLPLTKLFQVRQVSSCVNGPPLASIHSELEAQRLVDKCLKKFGAKINGLEIVDDEKASDCDTMADDDEEVDKSGYEVEYMDHRINSVTHLYLGATAGMRALGELDETRANEKIDWINQAINGSNRQLVNSGVNGPPINKGFVGIISGGYEAAFGWTSVNFVCETLEVKPELDDRATTMTKPQPVYRMDDTSTLVELDNHKKGTEANHQQQQAVHSVGTLELGGTSAQMAFQMDAKNPINYSNQSSFDQQDLDLFNGKYHLATRSDLCLGMSQAILRANYIILRDLYDASRGIFDHGSQVVLVNPCLQNSSRTDFHRGSELNDLLGSPCLVGAFNDSEFKSFMKNMSIITYVGTGETEECSKLLNNLLEPDLCAKYFLLCPKNKNLHPPPERMPFVTISGYNHALRALTRLNKGSFKKSTNSTHLELMIAKKFGGHSIDHSLFVEETRRFCSLEATSLIRTYEIDEHYYKVQCLQLVYINKLLTDFYKFDPNTSWRQIKFLLFPPEETAALEKGGQSPSNKECKMEIGWTLGLLLNATSQQLGDESSTGGSNKGAIGSLFYHHHGSTVIFILRATVILMFACVLLAISLIVTAVVSVKQHQRKAYLSPTGTDTSSVQSSWCSSINQV